MAMAKVEPIEKMPGLFPERERSGSILKGFYLFFRSKIHLTGKHSSKPE